MTAKHLGSVEEIRNCLTTRSVFCYKVAAERCDQRPAEDSKGTQSKLLVSHENEATQAAFAIRVQTSATTDEAEFTIDCAAVFDAAEPVTFDGDALTEFVNTVGLQIVHPHVREAAAQLALRLQVRPPALGFVKLSGGEVTAPLSGTV